MAVREVVEDPPRRGLSIWSIWNPAVTQIVSRIAKETLAHAEWLCAARSARSPSTNTIAWQFLSEAGVPMT